DDDGTTPFSLGRNTFNYYGTTFSNIGVGTNGIVLAPDFNSSISVLLEDWVTFRDANDQILGRYDDTNSDTVPDRLVLEWSSVYGFASSPSTATFQAILELNTGAAPGDMVFNYVDLDTGDFRSSGQRGRGLVGLNAIGGFDPLIIKQSGAFNSFVEGGHAILVTASSDLTATSHVTVNNVAPSNLALNSGT